ncbi:RGM domain family member B isoform X13 [Aquila chrysaetos chrysaetos]|uniref:RGM domain family member B isoform X13 n=1 Tax=Aquila chrysaetos chrysaetos TaxID=223781 RepID=UPI001176EE5C|nr:RGM domain family member B isoform X13 [Aquila chrysaetos chrysaetos]
MGRAAPSCAAGAEAPRCCGPRRPSFTALGFLAALGLLLGSGDCQLQTPCRIQKCTTDFVSLTSHLNSGLEGFDLEFCKALRAYSACTYRNSKACRGNLVYHSAVLGISDLMSQRNCSKDGPTSSTNPEVTHDPCNYSSHTEAREHRGGEKTPPTTYLFCGLFGDPHLRTFKDHFQTCKVEGAWPLIDNNYLSVQVTNVPVVPGSSATATNKAVLGVSLAAITIQVFYRKRKFQQVLSFRRRAVLKWKLCSEFSMGSISAASVLCKVAGSAALSSGSNCCFAYLTSE